MDEQGFHFAEPNWLLLGFILLPLLWWLVRPRVKKPTLAESFAAYADAHLLPKLLRGGGGQSQHDSSTAWPRWLVPALTQLGAVLMLLSLAGPRWQHEDVPLAAPDAAVMLVADISRSMLAADLKPSRIDRLRQEGLDLAKRFTSFGIQTGLIAFAASAHGLSPLTRDNETLKSLIQSLTPDIVPLQGSNTPAALELADKRLQQMAAKHGSSNLHIILMTDGDLADTKNGTEHAVEKLTAFGKDHMPVMLHIFQFGTGAGAPIPDGEGYYVQDDKGAAHISKSDEAWLKELAKKTGGTWVNATYGREDTDALFAPIMAGLKGTDQHMTWRMWKEGYPWFLIPAMAALLAAWWLRRLEAGEMP
ncbi:VWA domain-containing protein [bacterium]|nr:VWA domain-containing protein [bacterium]